MVSSRLFKKEGKNIDLFTERAGQINTIPVGGVKSLWIHIPTIDDIKFAPAESPYIIRFLYLNLKAYSECVTIQAYACQRSSRAAGNRCSGDRR